MPSLSFKKLYKFGFDKQANQKYQCKEFDSQFVPDSASSRPKSKYNKCNTTTYLHHKYKYYKCENWKYNNVFFQYHKLNIYLTSSENLTCSFSIKAMCFPLHTILTPRIHSVSIFKKFIKVIYD